jgi:hypothetical protein
VDADVDIDVDVGMDTGGNIFIFNNSFWKHSAVIG